MATFAILGHSYVQGREKHLKGGFPELTDPHGCAKSMDLDNQVSEYLDEFTF